MELAALEKVYLALGLEKKKLNRREDGDKQGKSLTN